jgi:membrane AbrB-like protein
MRSRLGDAAITARTIAIALCGGWIFARLDLPAPWFSGPMLATALMSMSGRAVLLPVPLRDLGLFIAGVAMGSMVSPEALALLARYPVSLAGLAISMLAGVFISAALLERRYGWDRPTAILSSIPGALTVVMILAAECKADSRKVAVVQAFRLFVLVAAMPLAVASATAISERPPQNVVGAADMAALFASAVALYAVLAALRATNALFLGAMVSAMLLHLTSLVPGALPDPVALLGFVLCGVFSGVRFEGLTVRMLAGMIGPAALSFSVTMAAAALCGLAVVLLTGLGLPDVMIAFAPGAFEPMILVGAALGLDTLYISTHHVARTLAVNTLLPLFPPRGNGGDRA